MKTLSIILDERIHSTNILAECTFEQYLGFARKIINNNEFQRKRVKTSKTVYALLKDDLKRGCIIPPIVLAVSNADLKLKDEELYRYICGHVDDVMILDGLQRTNTLIDASDELAGSKDYDRFKEYKVRLEIYTEINKFGILYRMLTLNTGQTPMSLRHQLEMLYSDMLGTDYEGIKLVKDTEGKADASENEFIFANVIDGFNSYLNRNELPIDREELLNNIKTMEKMSEDSGKSDVFPEYIESYVSLFNTLRKITEEYEVTAEDLAAHSISGNPFGRKVSKAFSSSQALTGFGAAVGRLKDTGRLKGFDGVRMVAVELGQKYDESPDSDWFLELLEKLEIIKNTSKKIGNAQRMLFQYFFRELMNSESDSYLDLYAAVENAYDKYLSQVT